MKRELDLHQKLALSIDETCAIAGVQKDTLYREINAGRLRTAKVRGRRLIRREALTQWLAERERDTVEAMGFEEAAR